MGIYPGEQARGGSPPGDVRSMYRGAEKDIEHSVHCAWESETLTDRANAFSSLPYITLGKHLWFDHSDIRDWPEPMTSEILKLVFERNAS